MKQEVPQISSLLKLLVKQSPLALLNGFVHTRHFGITLMDFNVFI